MNQNQIRFTFLFIASVVIIAVGLLFTFGHHSNFTTVGQKYMYIFKDSIHYKVDEKPASWVGMEDNLINFIYYDSIKDKREYYEVNDTTYNNYNVDVWHFSNLDNFPLNKSYINLRSHIQIPQYLFGETLDPESYCPVTIKFLYRIDGLILNISDDSKIIKEFSGKNYKGFYGLLNKAAICNIEGVPQVYYKFKEKFTPTIFIIHSGETGFHLIQINARKHVDENIIKILNLE